MRFPSSIQTRLVLSHLLVTLISIIFISTFASSAILQAARNELELNLEKFAIIGSSALEDPLRELYHGQGNVGKIEQILIQLNSSFPEYRYTLFLRDGSALYDSTNKIPSADEIERSDEVWQALESNDGKGVITRLDEEGENILYVAKTIEKDGEVLGILRLGFSVHIAQTNARSLSVVLYSVAALVSLVIALVGWLLARTISRPIQQLTNAATQLARGDLDTRVSPTGPQEIHNLAEVFNHMASRLQSHVAELRAFAANASHELRTPLTIVKLRVEALLSGALSDPSVASRFLEEIESEIDRLSRLVSDLLDLSRMEAGLSSEKHTQIILGDIINSVCEIFSIRAENAGVTIVKHLDNNVPPVEGNEDQLYRVLNNLLDNAIRYSPRGGIIEINLITLYNGDRIRLEVIDSGRGIAPNHLQHLFERFYRAEATRPRFGAVKSSSGSGLGLAIAKSIVDIHGGKIGVHSELGKGSIFWVELPTKW